MNSKKRRVTRKRCVRKCKKRTSRKLRGSRRYGGGQLYYIRPSASSMSSSINKRKPGESLLENHIQTQITSFTKSILALPKGDPIRTYMEKRIPKLKQELVEIARGKITP
jgi:hypothetical protein